MAAFTVPTIYTAVDKFTAPVRKMAGATSKFAKKTEAGVARANRAFRSLTSPIRAVGRQLGQLGVILGATALIGIASNAIGIFRDFEQANADLAAIMGTTIAQNKILADDAKRLGSITSKTASEVVGLQEAYARLGFTQQEILDVTGATINGSVALNAELADTAELTGAMIRTFDNFESVDAAQILDQLSLSTFKSALNFEKLQTALPIVGGAANALGVPFSKVLATLGKLSDAGIDASSSATALRNIFLESTKRGVPYEKLLQKVANSTDSLGLANSLFGKRAAVVAVTLAKGIEQTAELDKTLQGASNGIGAAAEAAATRLSTFQGATELLKSAYEGFILSIEDGNGPLAENLILVTNVASELLQLASGAALSTFKLTPFQKRVREVTKQVLLWGERILWVVGILAGLKLIILAVGLAVKIYNAGVLIAAGVTKAWVAAQWLINAALTANPIGLIIVAIAALIALIVFAIKKYNDWGAAVLLFLGPLGLVINMIQSFRRNWDLITEAFKTGGIVAGLKMIGKTILDAVLMPLQQLLQLIAKLPGSIGNFAAEAAVDINAFRADLGLNTETDEEGVALADADLTAERTRTERTEELQRQQLDINVNAPSGLANIAQRGAGVPIVLTTTQGFE